MLIAARGLPKAALRVYRRMPDVVYLLRKVGGLVASFYAWGEL